ncbi:hypothetical protein TSOC_007847 [Tetrabaena socialis]|uniref:Uncharacterized protein n=1 Tax=Tetrabaena socialis TaxID=47790 RepID=A0A2J8A017_9CHLO|nr:hypothetical protein TSOC_007847 [Tetrabaena socialis]|eukprot:PNH05860.1 hypothetical protein TSOC_007847 [Tetrabaena socialis]
MQLLESPRLFAGFPGRFVGSGLGVDNSLNNDGWLDIAGAGQGLGSARAAGTDGGCTTASADLLNTLGRAEEVMPEVTEDAGPDAEDGPQTATALCRKGSKPSSAKQRGPAQRGGRRAAPKRNVRGSRAGAGSGPPPLIYKGTIGGTANLQALSMPFAMSLQLLNHQLAAAEEAWPEADS